MTELTSNHFPQKVNMAAQNPFIDYYENQALGKYHQIGCGFYTDLPWQKGYVLVVYLAQLRVALFHF